MSELWCLGTADDYCLHRWHGNPVFQLSTRSLFILFDTCTRFLRNIRDHSVSLEVSGTVLPVGAEIWISESYPCDNNEFLIAQAWTLSTALHIFEDSSFIPYKGAKRKWICFDICHCTIAVFQWTFQQLSNFPVHLSEWTSWNIAQVSIFIITS